jgi:copper chaperone
MAQTIELNVTGMTCDHCVHAVTSAVKDVDGVAEAEVSLENKSALIKGDGIDLQKIFEAIEEEGYAATLK